MDIFRDPHQIWISQILGSFTKYGYLKIVQTGDPLGSTGDRIPEGGEEASAPLNPLLLKIIDAAHLASLNLP